MAFERSNLLKIACLAFLLMVTTPALAVFIALESPNPQLNGHDVANTTVTGHPIVTESCPIELDFIAELNNDATLVLDMVTAGPISHSARRWLINRSGRFPVSHYRSIAR